jgi:hypothetical protein
LQRYAALCRLKSLFEQFLTERRYLKNVTPATIEWYETAFKALQRAAGAESPPLTKPNLQQFVVSLRTRRKACILQHLHQGAEYRLCNIPTVRRLLPQVGVHRRRGSSPLTDPGCAIRDIASRCIWKTLSSGSQNMFRLIATMRRGSATGVAASWARYETIEAARLGTATLLHDDRILRVMIVRNEIPPAFVEWAER